MRRSSAVASILIIAMTIAAPASAATARPKFVLTSTAFGDGGTIPIEYTCRSTGTTPQLAWKRVPSGTKELGLIMEDPDAPSGTFVHWVVAGIKPKPPSIAADADPVGAFVGVNSVGRPGWQPPCPPPGPAHHYVFTLYAVGKKVTLPPGATAATLRTAMKGKILAKAKLVGLFGT
ncbi:MAG: YbhB/YbcL family Raf kinase inhibitor-like protein [Acidimicrobiia bacterium]